MRLHDTANAHTHAQTHTQTDTTKQLHDWTSAHMQFASNTHKPLATEELLCLEWGGGITSQYVVYLAHFLGNFPSGKDMAQKIPLRSLTCAFDLFIFRVFLWPEALQIQADVPKRGKGGRCSGAFWQGGRRTVQQVTFEPQHRQSLTADRFDGCCCCERKNNPSSEWGSETSKTPPAVALSTCVRAGRVGSKVRAETNREGDDGFWFLLFKFKSCNLLNETSEITFISMFVLKSF